MANSTNIIGKVVALQGQAIIKSPDGKQHVLKVGDVVYENDVIVAAPGAQVELAFDSGHNYLVRQNETVTLDASVFAASQTDIAKAALLPADSSPQNIANAVIGENSLDKLLEETAAGLGGGDASDGSSFVRLERIAENVTPSSGNAVVTTETVAAAPASGNATQQATDSTSVVSVTSGNVAEGGTRDFVVSLTGNNLAPAALSLALLSGSATVGTDTATQLVSVDGGQTFSPLNGSVLVPAGVTTVIVRVGAVNDGVIEGTENFTLSASTSSNTSSVTAQGSIVDGAVPAVSISGPISVNEASGTATFTVVLSEASPASVLVNFNTNNGSAIAGSDFTATTGSVTFAPGETSKTITITIADDAVFEGNESFQVNLSTPTNATIGNGSVVTLIQDDGTGTGGTNDDRPVVVSVSSPSVSEGGNLVFSVNLSGTSTTPTTVTVTPTSGTAILGTDTGVQQVSTDGGVSWSTLGGSVVVPAGATSFQVRVATTNDGLVEGSETINLSAATARNTSPVVGVGTITDGAIPTVSITGPADVNEAAGTITYTISLSAASVAPVSVNYASANGSALAPSDYAAIAGSVTFAPGETTKTITVAITNDTVFEGNENFQVNLSTPTNAIVGNGSVTTVIHDDGTGLGGSNDDRLTVVNVSSPTVSEGGNLVFSITLSGTSTTATTVSVTPSSGSAILGTDTGLQEVSTDGGATWSTLGAAVSVPAGVSGFQVRVATINDGLIEGSETINLAAAAAQNTSAVVGVGTILDGTVPSLNISGPADVNEAAGTVTYTISLSAASVAPVSVNYGTANGTALAGSDYTAIAGSVTFAPGETSKTITVAITNDTVFEGNENYQVRLSNPTNATIGNGIANTVIHDDGTGVGGGDDDRLIVVNVSSPTVGEGGNLVFSVTLNGTSTTPTTVSVTPSSGSAILGTDTGSQQVSTDGGVTWSTLGATVTVPAGASGFQVRVATINDGLIEGPETINLAAATVQNTSPVVGVGTIIDGAVPTVSISGPTDVNEAAGTITYTISLSATSAAAVSVNYGSSNGTALAGSDYSAIAGSVTFAPGETTKTITVAITNDTVFEGNENFQVSLSAPSNATLGNASVNTVIHDDGTGTGGNDDDRLTVVSVSSPTVTEGGSLVFSINLSGTSTTPTAVSVTPSSGTAILGTDTGLQEYSTNGGASWSPLGSTVTVPAGASSFQVRVATINDGLVESAETINLSAATAQNTSAVVGVGTILDGTVPTVNISGPTDVNEAAGTITYTISLSAASVAPVSVNYGTANGSALAGSDYTATAGSVTFAPGETSKTITVAITNDTVFEGNENFRVNLSSPSNATVGTGSVTTVIHDDGTGGSDDDRLAVVSVSSPTVGEGGNLVFSVGLSGTSTTATTVTVTPSSGSAILGTDTGLQQVSTDGGVTWSTLGATVTVPAGASSFQVRVATINDGLLEGAETINLSAATAQNASAVVGVGTITDGTVPTVSISGPADVNEAAGTITYTISLSAASIAPVSVNYGTVNGTALAGSDYVAAAGGVTFAPGETTKTITVNITNDVVFEGSENFQVRLSTPTNAIVGTGSVTTVIHDDGTGGTDDDRLTVVQVSSPTVAEGGLLVFSVSLSGTSTTATTVSISASSGTAILGTDTGLQEVSTDGGATWNVLGSSVTVPAGAGGFQVRIATINDGLLEGSETINLSAATAKNTSSVVGVGTITDGTVPTVSITGPAEVNEAAGTITYTISLSAQSVAPVSVNYGTANGTALAGSDYALTAGSVTFAPGETTKVITVTIINDTAFEGNENFLVNLSTPTNAILGTASVSTVIVDNDQPSITTVEPGAPGVAGDNVVEGNDLVYTVSLSATTTVASTYAYNLGGGTATAGADYNSTATFSNGVTLVGGSLIVPAGVSTFTVTVATINDSVVDSASPESLPLVIGGVTGNGGIIDDDQPSITTVEPGAPGVGGDNVVEGNDLVYTVSLSATTTVASTYAYNLGGGSATAGADYTSTATFSNGVTLVGGSLIVPAGVSTFTVTVATINDSVVDSASPESLPLVIGGVTGNGGIIDDDQPSITTVEPGAPGVAGDNVVEGNDLVYTVSLSATTTVASTYAYNLGGGTATAGADYN
ncbi:retention module-containing protein, partial [Undibacterium seohonense]